MATNVLGQLSSTPSSPRVVEVNSGEENIAALREEQPSNNDLLPEEPVQSTDTETKEEVMDETKALDVKETEKQDTNQGDASAQSNCQCPCSASYTDACSHTFVC